MQTNALYAVSDSTIRTRVRAAFLLLLLVLCCGARGGQSVSLAWDASASTGVAGYSVYRGTTSGVYTNVFDAGTNLALTLTGLPEGQTNYFCVVGYNSARMAGTPSAEIAYLVPGVMRLSGPARSGTPPTISFPVAVGHSYSIQASTNLSVWTTIYTTTSATSNAWVSWQDTGGLARRFYRLILN